MSRRTVADDLEFILEWLGWLLFWGGFACLVTAAENVPDGLWQTSVLFPLGAAGIAWWGAWQADARKRARRAEVRREHGYGQRRLP